MNNANVKPMPAEHADPDHTAQHHAVGKPRKTCVHVQERREDEDEDLRTSQSGDGSVVSDSPTVVLPS